jgi:hypothetical protein
MSLRKLILVVCCVGLALVAGCSFEQKVVAPAAPTASEALPLGADKDGSEALGPPAIAIQGGSGVSQGGVSMVGASSAPVTVAIPEGARVRQVLAYWAGGTQAASGDDQIALNGVSVQGQLIGGPTAFYWWEGPWYFSAYRADVTSLGLIGAGSNTVTVSGLNYTITLADENDGVSLVVIWDDGSPAEISLRDGMDLAFFGFSGALNATVPQTFGFAPATIDRVADLVILAASVGENRPNRIRVFSSAGEQVFDNPMGGLGEDLWDSLTLPVNVPAGDTEIVVELVSTPSTSPLGASMGWVCAALSVPVQAVAPVYYDLAGVVFIDADHDGYQSPSETGLPNVTVLLSPVGGDGGQVAVTGQDGRYAFNAVGGSYTVEVPLAGYPASFNADLAASFTATGLLSRPVVVGPETSFEQFGFVPDTDRILDDISTGALATNGFTRTTWRHFFRCAVHIEHERGDGDDEDDDGDDDDDGDNDGDKGRRRDGRDGGRRDGDGRHPGDGCGCNPDSLLYNADELRALLVTVQTLFLPEPFTFTPGRELEDAYRILNRVFLTDEEKLEQELLVTELNYVVGRGVVDHDALVASLAAWSESLLAWDGTGGLTKAGEKDRASDLRNALTLLEAVNTGGGGGGIE